MNNFINKLKRTLNKLYTRSYGMDDLNKVLLITAFIFSLLALFIKTSVINALSMIFMLLFLFRFFSSKKFARGEENRKFRKIIKYVQMKWKYHKTHRVFMCKNCKQLIKIPKGHGKVIVTCPNCGSKEEHLS